MKIVNLLTIFESTIIILKYMCLKIYSPGYLNLLKFVDVDVFYNLFKLQNIQYTHDIGYTYLMVNIVFISKSSFTFDTFILSFQSIFSCLRSNSSLV